MTTIKLEDVRILRKITPPGIEPIFDVGLGDYGGSILVTTAQLLKLEDFAAEVKTQSLGRCVLEDCTEPEFSSRIWELDLAQYDVVEEHEFVDDDDDDPIPH
jgi:hypothetical protein